MNMTSTNCLITCFEGQGKYYFLNHFLMLQSKKLLISNFSEKLGVKFTDIHLNFNIFTSIEAMQETSLTPNLTLNYALPIEKLNELSFEEQLNVLNPYIEDDYVLVLDNSHLSLPLKNCDKLIDYYHSKNIRFHVVLRKSNNADKAHIDYTTYASFLDSIVEKCINYQFQWIDIQKSGTFNLKEYSTQISSFLNLIK